MWNPLTEPILLFEWTLKGSLKRLTLPCCAPASPSSYGCDCCPTLIIHTYTGDNTQSSIIIQKSLHDYVKMAPSGSQIRHSQQIWSLYPYLVHIVGGNWFWEKSFAHRLCCAPFRTEWWVCGPPLHVYLPNYLVLIKLEGFATKAEQ